jgi:hypothetical protein
MIKILIALIATIITLPIHACMTSSEIRLADILMADEIFIGKVTNYELSNGAGLSQYATITFKVIDDIYNSSNGEIREVYWHNSTFGMLEDLNRTEYLVATTSNQQPRLRGPSATIFPSKKNKPSLLQAPCSSPFLLEPTETNMALIKGLLSTKDVKTNSDSTTFEFHSDGSIYVNTNACSGSIGRTKLYGVNHFEDDIEHISSMFIRVNGKLYDAHSAEFQRYKLDRTHNIRNPINEETFRVVDREKQYFTDDLNYYYYEYYPTSQACLHRQESSENFISIQLSEFQLSDPLEAKLYLSQENNVFTFDGSYTPFAKLRNKLYFKSRSGKFVEVEGASPDNIRELGSQYNSNFYTDGKNVIFQGEALDFKLDSFKQIEAGSMSTSYFKIGGNIYHLHEPTNARYFGGILTKTDIDAETFEAIDSTGYYSGIIFQDKNYIYELKYSSSKFEEVIKSKRDK